MLHGKLQIISLNQNEKKCGKPFWIEYLINHFWIEYLINRRNDSDKKYSPAVSPVYESNKLLYLIKKTSIGTVTICKDFYALLIIIIYRYIQNNAVRIKYKMLMLLQKCIVTLFQVE